MVPGARLRDPTSESVLSPAERGFVDLKEGVEPKTVRIEKGNPLAGEVSAMLKPAPPFFRWLGVK